RFVEVQGRVFVALCAFMKAKTGHASGLYYVDSTTIKVCRNPRINQHQIFDNIAERGKSSMGWFFGFKLHIVINAQGELMAFCLTPGNTDDRKPVPKMFRKLQGLAAGDKGYISKKMAAELAEMGINFITKTRRNMKKIKRSSFEKFFLAKRAIVEAVIGQLKEICQIEHSRHRKPDNFLVNLLAALAAIFSFNQFDPFWSSQINCKIHCLGFDFVHSQIKQRVIEHPVSLTPGSHPVFLVTIMIMDDCGLEI
ncbi:MAG: IS982 family transposase, partial [Planctomycetaceae bacterium]|nr:IS982 family transposase [Planctomycetaceae bacterium]